MQHIFWLTLIGLRLSFPRTMVDLSNVNVNTPLFVMTSRFSPALLLAFAICGASYSYFADNPLIINHRHRRRSTDIQFDPRSLNFRFVHEPSNTIASSDGSALLACNYSLASPSTSPILSEDNALFSSNEADEAAGGTLARVEWRKDGSPIHPLGRIKLLQNGSLWIGQTTPVDEGQYQCAVHVVVIQHQQRADDQQYGKESRWVFLSRRASLSLRYLHRFEQQPTDQHARIGQMAAFRCLLSSQPPAQIEWYHDNQLLKDGQDAYLVLPISQTLEIAHVRPSHAGVYKCVARNGERSRTSQLGTLIVLDGEESSQSMNWVLEPRNQLVTVGDTVLLECLANNGGPRQTTKIQWLHNSEQLMPAMATDDGAAAAAVHATSSLPSSSSIFALVGRRRSHLLIRNITAQMAGQYTCRAANSWRTQDVRATVAVRVPPLLTTRPVDVLTQETNDVEFECVAEGVPTPRITWSKNGEVIIPSEYFVIASNKLRIFGLVRDDQGVYQCMADNEVGTEQSAAQLLIDQADILSSYYSLLNRSTHQPIPDDGLDPSLVSMDSLPSHHHLHGVMESKNLTSASPLPLISPYSSNNESVVGGELVPQLSAAQPLSMPATAAIEAKSAQQQQQERDALPPPREMPEEDEEEEDGEREEESQIVGAPSELRVMATHDSVQVSWLPPRDNIVLIRGYLIGWGINIPDVEKATVEPEVRHFTIRGLKPNREYVISLRAFNKVGHGFPIYETVKTSSYGVHSSSVPFSEPKSTFGGFGQHHGTNANGLSAPVGVVAQAISSSQIRLAWTDPNQNAFNQIYTIKYGVSNSDEAQHKLLNSTETEHTFEGLRPDTQYEFAVRLAQSPHWSLNAVTRTQPAPPSSPPRDLTIIGAMSSHQQVDNDPSTVTLAWQPPKYSNGEIQEYIVLYSDRPNLPDRDWMMDSVKGDKLSIAVPKLRPALTYHFKLQARNVKGYGPFTPVTSFTTAADAPSHAFPNAQPPPSTHSIHNTGTNADTFGILMGQFFDGLRLNFAFVLIGVVVAVVVLLLCIALFAVCFQRNKNDGAPTAAAASNRSQQRRKMSNKRLKKQQQQKAYIPGRKMSVSTPSAVAELDDDLWLVHQQRNSANPTGGRFATLVNTSNVDEYQSTTVENGAGILLIDDQQRAFIAPSNAAGLNFQSTAMECLTPKHYQQSYHAATQRHGGNGDDEKGISSVGGGGVGVPFVGQIGCSSPLLHRGMMESFHSMTAAGDSPKNGNKSRNLNRNSLPPHICPSNSASVSPFLANKCQQQQRHCHCCQHNNNSAHHHARSDQFGVEGGEQRVGELNFGRRSDSPIGIRSPCHQRVACVRMQCSGRISKSSLNALDLSISPRLGHAVRQPTKNALKSDETPVALHSDSLLKSVSDECDNGVPQQQQQFHVGIGLPSMALQVKHAKRTTTANYETTLAATRRHAGPTKSVNFASKLVIVSSDDDDDEHGKWTKLQHRWNGGGKRRGGEGVSFIVDDAAKAESQKQQNNHSSVEKLLNGCDGGQKVVPLLSSSTDLAMDSVGTLPRGHPNRYHLHSSSASLEMNSTPQPMHIHQQQQQHVGQQQQQHFGGTPLTPRNPHVVYTRVDRQPVAKMDFSVNGPAPPPPLHDAPHNQQQHQFGVLSASSVAGGTPPLAPPPSLTTANRSGTTANAQQHNRNNDSDGYQTVGGRANAGGTMRSFVVDSMTTTKEDTGSGVGNCDAAVQMVLAEAAQHNNKPQQQQRMAHIVRPIVYAGGGGGVIGAGASPSPSTLRSAIGQPQAQKTTPTSAHKFAYNTNGAKVPVGRATVQPRVNLAAAAAAATTAASVNSPSSNALMTTLYGCSSSQYASVRVTPSSVVGNGASAKNNALIEHADDGIKVVGSTEDLQEIDQMIETLQQLQHDFTEGDNVPSP